MSRSFLPSYVQDTPSQGSNFSITMATSRTEGSPTMDSNSFSVSSDQETWANTSKNGKNKTIYLGEPKDAPRDTILYDKNNVKFNYGKCLFPGCKEDGTFYFSFSFFICPFPAISCLSLLVIAIYTGLLRKHGCCNSTFTEAVNAV